MHRLTSILSAVDFSNAALAAFDHALALGREHGAAVSVVHAVPADQPFRWRARERVELMAVLRAQAEAAGVSMTVSVQQGDPAGVILLHARSRRPDLVVMGTHGRTGISWFRHGSVAERVALQAAQPVLVVPDREREGGRGALGGIVVAVDFSGASDRAVQQALALSGNRGAPLTFVHVVPGSAIGVPPHRHRYGVVEYQRRVRQDAWRRLQEAVPRHTTAAVRVVTGDAAAQIARIAADTGANLIVVGVKHRRPLSRRLFGGTAARLLRVATLPVVAVPEGASPEAAGADAWSAAA
jgi:nucleotide-binding universal stress UspA family protein